MNIDNEIKFMQTDNLFLEEDLHNLVYTCLFSSQVWSNSIRLKNSVWNIVRLKDFFINLYDYEY